MSSGVDPKLIFPKFERDRLGLI